MSTKKQNRNRQGGNTFMKNKSNTIFKQIRLLSMALSLLFLSGCASWFYTPGMSELKRLCELDGGDKIYKTVYTDGYFDVNGRMGRTKLMGLIRSDYQYIEYEETEKVSYGSSTMKEPGIWRIYKSHRNNPQCQAHLDKVFAVFQHPKDQDIRDFFASNCLAARTLEKPESQYWYRNSINTRYLDKNQEVELVAARQSIDDVNNDNVIATKKYYRLLPYKKSSLDYALSFNCKDAGVEIKSNRFPESILLPKNSRMK